MRVKRILTAIDLEDNLPTLDAAFSIAEKFDAELVVMRVIDDPLVQAEETVYPLGNDDEAQHSTQAKELDTLVHGVASKHQLVGEVKTIVVRGKTGNVVRRETSKLEIDLLVVGHRPEWRLEHFLFGRTFDRIVDRSSCMVLVVPEPDLE